MQNLIDPIIKYFTDCVNFIVGIFLDRIDSVFNAINNDIKFNEKMKLSDIIESFKDYLYGIILNKFSFLFELFPSLLNIYDQIENEDNKLSLFINVISGIIIDIKDHFLEFKEYEKSKSLISSWWFNAIWWVNSLFVLLIDAAAGLVLITSGVGQIILAITNGVSAATGLDHLIAGLLFFAMTSADFGCLSYYYTSDSGYSEAIDRTDDSYGENYWYSFGIPYICFLGGLLTLFFAGIPTSFLLSFNDITGVVCGILYMIEYFG